MSWDILPKANLQYFLQKLKGKFDEIKQAHTIKNDSGTALAYKDNLKFAGTYSVNSGDDSVVNIVRTVNSESAISQMSAAEKKGIIVVDDGQAEEIDAYDVPYGNSDVGTALDGKVNTSDIVDNLATNDATKPLSAKQGKVLKEVYTRVGTVIRPDSTYTTLLSYINGYVVSLDRQEYTFACEGFSDMPRTDWSYDCTVTRGVGLTARLHRALSNDEDWIREVSYNGQWADSWRRVFYDDNLWAVGNLLSNHYQPTADAWTTNIQIGDDVTKYGFLGFSYHMGDNSRTNNLCRVFIPTADFVNSTTSTPIPIVLDPYNPQDSTCVYVCYVNNTTIGVYRGSGVNQWLRLFMVGYFKR